MAWVEVTSKRERKAKHFFDISTGKWMAEFTIHDQHYKDAADTWQDVDESLTDDITIPGLTKKCDKTQHAVYLGNGGERRWYPRRNVTTEYVSITGIEYYTNRWRSLNLPTPVWNGNGASWNMANLSAQLVNTWKQIKTSFVLKDATAPTRLRFALELVGLTLDTATWEVRSGTTVVGSIPPPTFTDANSTDEVPVYVPVTTTYANGYIEWAVNPAGATYPLTSHSVTFTDGYGGDVETAKDTELRASNTDAAYGTNANFGAGNTWLFQFTLSSIDSTSTCDSATFSIYNSGVRTSDRVLGVYSILSGNDGWTEGATQDPATGSQSTWDYKNQTGTGAGTTWAGTVGCATSGTDFNGTAIGQYTYPANTVSETKHDIAINTTAVASWFGASNSNYGIRCLNVGAPTFPEIYTSDHATTGYRPKLVVVYTEAGITVNLNVATLSASAQGITPYVSPKTDVLDDFNRANENPLNPVNWGDPFTTDQGAWKVVSNQAVPAG